MKITKLNQWLCCLVAGATLSASVVLERVHRSSRSQGSDLVLTANGEQVASFFQGLPANAAVVRALARPVNAPACARDQGLLSKMETMLGLATVVYAQTTCSGGTCSGAVTLVSQACPSNCSGGTYVAANPGSSSFNTDGTYACGGSADLPCGCNYVSC